jgi:FtsZ-interacting cell division protein ZipA
MVTWTWILIAIAVAAGVVALTARRSRSPMNDPDPMNDPESTQDTAQSTEQIANAGTNASSVLRPQPDPVRRAALEDAGNDSQDRASWVLRPLPDTQTGQPDPARRAALSSDPSTGGQPYAQLLESHEMQRILGQWKDIQAAFVDEPRKAVQDADALVAELMQRLAQTFASQREQLESQWAGGDDVSTEDLRRSLRRYRSFFERLLAA